MKLRDYIESRILVLCFYGMIAVFFLIYLMITDASLGLILSAEFCLFLIVSAWLITEYLIVQRRLRHLRQMLHQLPDQYLSGEILPEPQDAVEHQYYEIMKTISRDAIGKIEEARRDKEDYCNYVENWIHEIKTPLTACSLILQNGAEPDKLKRELKRADNLTENILYYARLKTGAKDRMIRECQIADVINESIRSQMELLIAARISVEVQGEFRVKTDDKAVSFILRQLLINAVRYCPSCHIVLRADKEKRIVYEDNGIGIPAQDIRRVTQRGFTGTNGRMLGSSTGMGLYIVEQLCERLDIEMKIESEQGRYTRITFQFTLQKC